jgi:hypothetical protein
MSQFELVVSTSSSLDGAVRAEIERFFPEALTSVTRHVRDESSDDAQIVASVFLFAAGTVIVAGSALFLKAVVTGAGEETGRRLADSVLNIYKKAEPHRQIFLSAAQIEKILELPEGPEREAARLRLGSSAPVLEIKIRDVSFKGGISSDFSFKFPAELTDEAILDAIEALGNEYPSTLSRLFEEEQHRGVTPFGAEVKAIYDPNCRRWLGAMTYIRSLREARGEETDALIRKAAQNRKASAWERLKGLEED